MNLSEHGKQKRALMLLLCSICLAPDALHALPQSTPLPDPGPVFTAKASRLLGIYEPVPPGEKIPVATTLPFRTLDILPLNIAAQNQVASSKAAVDPKDLCQVLGPFRVMARPDIKFEILRDAPNKFVILFEQSSWGHVRTIGLDAEHVKDFTHIRPMWNGDSIAKWEGDTLVVDTIHFTNKTWLNEKGVTNSKQLQLTERLRLLDGGNYLEYQATAVDPEVLAQPVSYARYFRRTTKEIMEYNCFAHKPVLASMKP